MRSINKETNSYFTKDEIGILESNGFSWSNESHRCSYGYDNHFYKQSTIRIDINVAAKKRSDVNGNKEKEIEVVYNIEKNIPTLFGEKRIRNRYESFDELIQDTKKVYVSNFIYILNTFLFTIIYTIFRISLLFIPTFIKSKKEFKEYISHLKYIWKFKYYFLNDGLPFVWGMNLFIAGIVISKLI